MGKIITGYKGFDRDWKCRDFQYEVGKTYEIEGEPELCERGYHFCTSPLAVFDYYAPTNRFAIVEADENDVIYDPGANSYKAVARRITIVKEITLDEIISLQMDFSSKMKRSGEGRKISSLGCENLQWEGRSSTNM
jgi:hypothetical protein